MRGPKPKPKPAKVELPPPAPPAGLTGPARDEWIRIAALLAKRRVLAPEDEAAMQIYCTSYAQYMHAQAEIDRTGTVIENHAGVAIKNPYCHVQGSAFIRMRPLLAELGLTPSARARLKLTDDAEAEDEFAL